MTDPDTARIISAHMAELARRVPRERKSAGGLRTWANLTPEARAEKMAKVRAAKAARKGREGK